MEVVMGVFAVLVGLGACEGLGAVDVVVGKWRGLEMPSFGQNMEVYDSPFRPSASSNFSTTFATINSGGLLRYPGGSAANWWNSTTGWFCEQQDASCANIPAQYSGAAKVPWTIGEVGLLHDAGGVGGVSFVANLVSATVEDNAGWLREFMRLDIPISLVELGNEPFLTGDAGVIAKWPSVEVYLEDAMEAASLLRTVVGNGTKIGLPMYFSGLYATAGNHEERYDTWNARVVRWMEEHGGMGAVDGFVIHSYFVSGLDYNPGMNWAMCWETAQNGSVFGTPALQALEESRFNASQGASIFHSIPFAGFQNFSKELASLHAPLFLTESNMLDWCGPTRLTWAHGLYTAAWHLLAMADERVQTSILYGASGNPLFTAMVTWPQTFQGLCCNWAIQEAYPFSPSALGITFANIGQAAQNATHTAPLAFPNSPIVRDGYMNTSYPALTGITFKAPHSPNPTAVILNLSPKPIQISIKALQPRCSNITHAPYTKWVARGMQDVTTTSSTSSTITMPPWSIANVE